MPRLTRRDLLKAGLAVSASAVTADAAGFLLSATERDTEMAAQFTSEGNSTAIVDVPASREHLLLDFDWRFHLGHAANAVKDFGWGASAREAAFQKGDSFFPVTRLKFDDSDWRTLDLPHDWVVELPFQNGPERPDHASKPIGRNYPETSIGWYRRVFEIGEADTGKRISVEFDGVFRQATIFFNGFYIGENFSGYAPFRFDLTDYANYGGKNVLTVRVDASLSEGWFYEGAGIYRHVWLTKTDSLHVAQWGTYARSEIQGDSANVFITTEVENEDDIAKACRVVSQVVDHDGRIAHSQTTTAQVSPWGRYTFAAQVAVPRPMLWSIEEPHLYRVITTLESDGTATDRSETTFGIRTLRFDADKGFFLNGKAVKIKGTCNHQDHAGVGSALPDRLQYYRIARLKEMQSNAYRTSHNPATPELLDACDHLGMLVMGETRMMASTPEGLSQLERMIRRDRNHPSIILWSLGNEERAQGTPRGAKIVASMKRLVRKLDPSRPATVAMDDGWGRGISDVVDVQGFNYAGGSGGADTAKNIDEFHKRFPTRPTVGSETASAYSTRGIYANDKEKGYVSAYDVDFPDYGLNSEGWWKVFAERSFLSGGFVWTGFDYRGEPSPYKWPCVSSHFGIMDTCGFPKDNYFYYKAWWGTEPVLHLFPHWNWAGKEGQEIAVWCHTNLESVELFLNGASLGSKKVERNSHVEWKVKYTPGVLEARGSRSGQVVLTEKRETTGAPNGIVLHPDRREIAADGEDVSVIAVEVVDAQRRVVPVAANEVNFKVTGPARVIGVGNGDPSCHEPDKADKRSAFNGLCIVIVQALRSAGEIRIEASAEGLVSASILVRAEAVSLRPSVG